MRFEKSPPAGIADDLWLAFENDHGFSITLERSWFTASYMNRATGEKAKLGDFPSFESARAACIARLPPPSPKPPVNEHPEDQVTRNRYDYGDFHSGYNGIVRAT